MGQESMAPNRQLQMGETSAASIVQAGVRSSRARVVEIYPGAAERSPVRQSRKSQGGGLDASALRRLRRSREPRRFRLVVRLARGGRLGKPPAEDGMATAEYAIATLAAVAFAGLLVVIMRSDEVRGFLLNIVRAALALP